MSKGSWQRPMDKEKFDNEFDRIFGKKEGYLSVTNMEHFGRALTADEVKALGTNPTPEVSE